MTAQSVTERVLGKDFGRFVGTAPVMSGLYREIEQVAASEERVLIRGETGTGKKLAAWEIRDRSKRRDGPFVVLNCAGFDHGLIERELFGHVKGAFTGATESKKGLFEAADGGILLLDEAASMSPDLQGRLLDILESGCVRRIGTTETRQVDVRVLAATNGDLWQRIDAGHFREDLFWRLAVGLINLPPLRERREDIPRLVEHFASQCAPPPSPDGDGAALRFTPEAMKVFVNAEWPGNVRQLDYAIHRINMRHTDRSKLVDRRIVEQELERLGRSARRRRRGQWQPCTLSEIEEQHIRSALRAMGPNTTRAAKILGIGRSTLYRKMQTYDIDLSNPVPESSLVEC